MLDIAEADLPTHCPICDYELLKSSPSFYDIGSKRYYLHCGDRSSYIRSGYNYHYHLVIGHLDTSPKIIQANFWFNRQGFHMSPNEFWFDRDNDTIRIKEVLDINLFSKEDIINKINMIHAFY